MLTALVSGCASKTVGSAVAGSAAMPTASPTTGGTSRATSPTAASAHVSAPAATLTRPTPLPASVSCAYPASDTPAAKAATVPPTTAITATGTVAAMLATSAGDIRLTLDRALAPCTVNSFTSLAKQGYFNHTHCHRLTTDPGLQVLQCGDPSGTGSGGPGYTFDDEVFAQLTYGRGALAMANAGPSTNGSQFFLVYGKADIPPNYTVFGSVDPSGLAVLDRIAQAGTADGGTDGEPKARVDIASVAVGAG